MKNSEVKRGNVAVHPRGFDQLADWMADVLTGRTFTVISTEVVFFNVPVVYDHCRLDESKSLPPIRFSNAKMQIVFRLDGPDDIFVPVGGLGKLTVEFLESGFVVENAWVGKWESKLE